ncbi:MAG: hypothetical protein J0H17_09570 [Rhizobiales bacterium]|nr:hypothetical protein [Hyphomicrobiales bacterium]
MKMTRKPRLSKFESETACERCFDEVVAAIAAGSTLVAALTRDPLFPSAPVFQRFVARSSDLTLRLREAQQHREEFLGRNTKAAERKFDRIVASIENGACLEEALEQHKVGAHVFRKFLASSSLEHSLRLKRAREARARKIGHRRGLNVDINHRRRTDEELTTALAAIASGVVAKSVVGYAALLSRARKDPALRRRLLQAHGTKRSRIPYAENSLQQALLQNEVYAAAAAHLLKGTDNPILDDMRSDVVLAILEGRIHASDRNTARAYAKKRIRTYLSKDEQSLDSYLGTEREPARDLGAFL